MSCQTYCKSCVECQGCVKCQGCDECLSFCETGGQNSANGFSFGKCVSSGQIISFDNTGFSRSNWNDAIERINSVFLEGDSNNAAWATISINNSDIYMKADEFKRVASAADYTSDNSSIYSGAIIYGTYFSRLEDAVANLNYKWNQCDHCDSECNDCVTCDACDSNATYGENACADPPSGGT